MQVQVRSYALRRTMYMSATRGCTGGEPLRITPRMEQELVKTLTEHRLFGPKEDFVKAPEFYDVLGISGALVAMRDPKAHRLRRNIMNPAFTPQAAARQEPEILDGIQRFLAALRSRCAERQHTDSLSEAHGKATRSETWVKPTLT